MKEPIVRLREAVQSRLDIITCNAQTQTFLAAGIARGTLRRRADRIIAGGAVIVGAIVVIEQGAAERSLAAEGVLPGQYGEGVGFALHVIRNLIRAVGNLIVVMARRGGRAQLVLGPIVVDQ